MNKSTVIKAINNTINNYVNDWNKHGHELFIEHVVNMEKLQDKMNEYPGDQTIKNLLLTIFQDDELCKNRLSAEIKLHQQTLRGEINDYSKLLR